MNWALQTHWRAEASTDAELVRRALGHFRNEPFRYTLNTPLLSRHSVDEFLFESRSGFCEHYASSFTIMMRMAGIPARVVTGYQGGWYNELGRYVLVRQSDAHAWSEVWLPGVGWTRIDPTAAVAPGRIERGALDALQGRRFLFDYEWVRNLRNTLDLVDRTWNKWVIAFDAERQSRLLEIFGIEALDTRALVLLMFIAFIIAAALITPWLMRLHGRRTSDPVVRAWQKFLHRLEKAGVHIRYSMGPMEVAEAVAKQLPDQAAEVRSIASQYLLVRYAKGDAAASSLTQAVQKFQPRLS